MGETNYKEGGMVLIVIGVLALIAFGIGQAMK